VPGPLRYRGLMRLFSRERSLARSQGSGEGSVSEVLRVASDRIRGIVEAAELASNDISAKVRSTPGMQGDDTSRISRERLAVQLAESLVARADELSREAADLADVLDRAASRLGVVAPGGASKLDANPDLDPDANREPEANREHTSSGIPAAAARPMKPPEVARSHKKRSNLSKKVSERFQDANSSSGETASRFKRRANATKASRPVPSGSTEGFRLLATQMAVAGSTHEEIASRLRDEFGVEDASGLLAEAPVARKVKELEADG